VARLSRFYKTILPAQIYDHTWQRLIAAEGPIRGLGAPQRGATSPLVGIAHCLFHAHAWTTKEVCYLQDLFVHPAARGNGTGQALIEAVAAATRDRGCHRLYWTTKEGDASARALYDRIAARCHRRRLGLFSWDSRPSPL